MLITHVGYVHFVYIRVHLAISAHSLALCVHVCVQVHVKTFVCAHVCVVCVCV